MKRYETDVREDVLYLETDEGRIKVGSMDAICDLLGGETYTLEYDERQRRMAWLDTDDDGSLTFDVREALAEMSYEREFVENVADIALDETDEEGYPLRTAVFASMMESIWDAKGDL